MAAGSRMSLAYAIVEYHHPGMTLLTVRRPLDRAGPCAHSAVSAERSTVTASAYSFLKLFLYLF